ncbi:MAG: 16S rRNA (cytidine(1402)-2'-O)-methyltransferase [Candidatus Cloacimonadota bacterium]
MKSGTVYLVPTPIGNLGDMTYRAVEVLKSVALIAAEDTRSARRLLQHFEIAVPRLISYHKFSEKQRIPELLEILKTGGDIAIISDAGSPGISDPSQFIVDAALEAELEVIALPGATAFVPALTASGLPCRSFCFIGFLPTQAKEKRLLLQRLSTYPETLIFYEAPHRLQKMLTELYKTLGNRRVVLARELSKIYEEYTRGDLESLLSSWDVTEKGEFVVLLEGAQAPELDPEELRQLVLSLLKAGKKASEIQAELSGQYPRNQIYQCLLSFKKRKA